MRKLKINQIHPETQKGTKIFLNQKEKGGGDNRNFTKFGCEKKKGWGGGMDTMN